MNTQHAIRLLQESCALNHTALSTEKTYIYWIRQYAGFLQQPQRRPLLTAEAKMEGFLTHLALKGVSASTQNQAFNALLFFYRIVVKQQLGNIQALRANRPVARVMPDSAETLTSGPSEGCSRLSHPSARPLTLRCGLRVCEPLNMRIKDLDLKERRLHIYQAKGKSRGRGDYDYDYEGNRKRFRRRRVGHLRAAGGTAQEGRARTEGSCGERASGSSLPGTKKYAYAESRNAGPGCSRPRALVATLERTN